MIIRAIRYIITEIFWRLFFRHLHRIDFINLINSLRVYVLSLSFRNFINFFWGLISNRLPNNNVFGVLPTILNVNISTLADTNFKRLFWLAFVSTLVIYKQFILFKRLILWPFKLGIFSFIFSTLGIDLSWLLNWFNFFPVNIPKWVYFQYLILYRNWLNWWNKTVYIKNLTIENPLPKTLNYENSNLIEASGTDQNKIFNRRNLFILLGIITIVGVGIWYFYFNGNSTVGGNGNIPPAGNIPPFNPTDYVAGLTEAQRVEQLDIIERLRLAGRISMAEYDNLRERYLPPLPQYQAPTVDATETVIEASSSNTQAQGSTSRSSPTHPDPNLAKEYNRLFQLPEGSTPGASGSGIERSNTPPIETTSSNSSGIERSTTPPILPEASSSSSSSEVVSRPVSPTGSTDSSETITSYTDSKGKQKVMITRRD